MRKPVVLITGAGGEIGHALVARLAEGATVMVIGSTPAVETALRARWPRLAFVFKTPSMGYIRKRAERRAIAAEVPEILVGAGTIVKPGQATLALDAGAQFLVSPGTTGTLLRAMQDTGLPFLPGTATVSEVLAALEAGKRRRLARRSTA